MDAHLLDETDHYKPPVIHILACEGRLLLLALPSAQAETAPDKAG